MAVFRLYQARNLSFVEDLSSDLLHLSYNMAPYGSLEGDAKIEVTPANSALLNSLTENSHFVKVSPDSGQLSGSVIDDAFIDKGICYISIIGFLEYLEKVPLIASHKATAIGESTTVPVEDPSWIKTFYSDSNLGLFWEIFNNLSVTMAAQGYVPFFTMTGIESLVESGIGQDWGKSYRLNSLETPNVAQVYSDLTEDDVFLPVNVSVSSGSTFSWSLSGITSYDLTYINESVDQVHTVSVERGNRIQRAMALASGSDPKENNLISKISASEAAAYSAVFADSASKSSLDIARSNRANIAGASIRKDQLTFSTWDSSIDIFSAVSIEFQSRPTILAVITQKVIDGQSVVYTGTIVDSVNELIPGIKKPTSEARRLIFDPAKQGYRRSVINSLQKQQPTGWR